MESLENKEAVMDSVALLDAAGRRRSPATLPGLHAGRSPRNKGMRYPADPPRVEEIIAVMRQAGPGVHGHRLRALVVVLWRSGLRIQEALDLRWTRVSRGMLKFLLFMVGVVAGVGRPSRRHRRLSL